MTRKPAASPTMYVVLRRSRIEVEGPESGHVLEQLEKVATVTARSAEGAIRQVAALPAVRDLPNPNVLSGAQVLVAIPARSFRPVTVTAEVQTKLKLESA